MAEPVAVEQPDLNAGVSATSPGQKRKRGSESASPESRRAKRGAPTANMSHSLESAAAFMEANENAQLAANISANISAELSALQQATAEHNEVASPDAALASSTAAAALGSMYPTMHVPQPTAETFAAQNPEPSPEHHPDASSYSAPPEPPHMDGLPMEGAPPNLPPSVNGLRPERRTGSGASKPAVGSEEWHKMRKDNHKEVERRRRETINEGINELAKIVPGCEKNKGSILQRAVQFITQLKENETQNIEKWTLEKLLTEQAIAELSASNDKLKAEVDRLYREVETWKRAAQNAGLQPGQEKPEGS